MSQMGQSGTSAYPSVASADLVGLSKPNWLSAQIAVAADRLLEDAICVLNRDGHVVQWCTSAHRMFGWTEDEALDRPIDFLFTESDVANGHSAGLLARACVEGGAEEVGWRKRKDGSAFIARTVMSHIVDPGGREIGFVQFIRDLTEHVARTDSIGSTAMLLRSILATVPQAMVVIDEAGRITEFSAAAEALFGYSAAEVVGCDVSLLMPSPDREAHDRYLERYLLTGDSRVIGTSRRVIGQRKDGTTFPHDLMVGEARYDGKRVFTGFMRDLTAQEAAEAQLIELQDELTHISRVSAMGTMASTLAHELNQPLTSVVNYVETSLELLKEPTEDLFVELREALTEAAPETLRAAAIVRSLREFVSRGKNDRKPESIAVLIDESCTLGLLGSREKGIVSDIKVSPPDAAVLVDRIQIQQVLINLLRNAMDAMASTMTCEIAIAASAHDNLVEVIVADRGPGLDPNIGNQLFTAFVSTKRDGMGLGLSICRTIVEAHGGKIWTEARNGGGTEFHFTLPQAKLE
jgi:two-component system, LuxR family, sensor kinase FixL